MRKLLLWASLPACYLWAAAIIWRDVPLGEETDLLPMGPATAGAAPQQEGRERDG